MTDILTIDNLEVQFHVWDRIYRAVDGISFSIPRSKSVALVGESGCGKTVTALSVMRLLPRPQARVTAGQILYDGNDLLKMPMSKFQKEYRGRKMGMIFQDPHSVLNPVISIKTQIKEHVRYHLRLTNPQVISKALEIFSLVNLREGEDILSKYPHQLSGGQIQRLMIAMTLMTDPDLIIADEPTTALDVTIQRQILELMVSLKEKREISYLLITHNLAIVHYLVDFVCIMYAGQIVENGPCTSIFTNPLHPYTQGLLDSVLTISRDTDKRIQGIQGMVPEACDFPSGCRFHPRCHHKKNICTRDNPPFFVKGGHSVRCWLYG